MSLTSCASCGRQIDVDPLKCPYCGVLQRNRAADAGAQKTRLALFIAGLGMGAAAGSFAARPARPSMRVVPGAAPPAPGPALESFETRVRGRARHLSPYRLVDLESLYLTPERFWGGEAVAVPGLITEAKIGWGGSTVHLSAQWATETQVTVDIGNLNKDYQKRLVAGQDAHSVFLVKGKVATGGTGPPPERLRIIASEIEPLGEASGDSGPARVVALMSDELARQR